MAAACPGVIGRVVRHREPVARRVELHRVLDPGAGERSVEQFGLLGGERVVAGGACHVDGGGDPVRGKVRARRVVRHRQPATVERGRRGDHAAEPARRDHRHAPAQAVAGGADRGPAGLRPGKQELRVGPGIGDNPVAGERADQAHHPGPLPRVGEQRSHVERRPLPGTVVDVGEQRDVPHARQVVAHLPERLPHPARVREHQHPGPRAVPVGHVQRPVAVAVGRGDLNLQASHAPKRTTEAVPYLRCPVAARPVHPLAEPAVEPHGKPAARPMGSAVWMARRSGLL